MLATVHAAHADVHWDDSPDFTLDLSPARGVGWSDSGDFGIDLRLVHRVWGDSNAFGVSSPGGVGTHRVVGLTASYGGVFAQGVDVINTITATVDWAGRTPSMVVFQLNGAMTTVPTSSSTAQTTYNMASALAYSSGGTRNDLLAYAVAADGSASPPVWLNLYGLALPQWATSELTKPGNHPPGQPRVGWRIEPLTGKLTFFGEVELLKDPNDGDGKVSIPESIPEVGGEYGLDLSPFTFGWELSAQPRFGDGAGLTGSFGLSGSWGAEVKAGSRRRGEVSATLSGAGEFYPQFRLTDVSAELAGSFTFLSQRWPLLCGPPTFCCHTGYCPYFQLSIKPEIAGTVGMEEGEPALIAGLKFRNAALDLAVTVAGTVGAGSEGSIYYIAGTIGGRPSVTLQYPGDASSMCLNEYVQQAQFDLLARFVVECAWWRIERNMTFNIFRCPDGGQYLVGTPIGEPQFDLVDRGYLHAAEGYCVFPPAGQRSVGALPDPILNVGTGPTPALATASDRGLLLFVSDNPSQPTGRHQEIYFARWTGASWTANALLTDNDRPDFEPAAAIDSGGTEVAVWVQAPTPTGSETGPRDILPGCEIVYSKYVGGNWTAPQAITNNGYADLLPWFEKLPGGGLRVCWVSSATNAVPVWHDERIAPLLDVMAADWDGSAFGTSYAVTTGLQTASPPGVARSTTTEFMTYLLDTDNDSGTAEDREVVVRSRDLGQAWGPDVQLTTDALSDTSAQIAVDTSGNALVVWVKGMVPVTLPDLTETSVDQLWFSTWAGGGWTAPALAFENDGITEAKLIRNDAGRLLIFWVAASPEFADLYYSVFDSNLTQWGVPQQVTHDQGAETMTALSESGGNILAAFVKRRIDLVSDPNGLPQIGLSDIYLLQHVPAQDLFVAAGDISFTPDPVVPGQSANVCANVHLSGDFTTADVSVSFYDGDPAASGVLIDSTTIPLILPGQAQPACVSWTVPNDGQAHQVFVVVDPANTIPETDDTLNNNASRGLFAPDLRNSAPSVTAYPSPDSVLVGCTIRNDGNAIAGESALEVRQDSPAGPVVYSTQLPPVPAGGSSSVQFAWDVTSLPIGTYTLVFLTDASNAVVESNETNNLASLLVRVMGDLQAEPWSATYDGANAQVVVRNVGAKPMAVTVVRATQYGQTLAEAPLGALAAGDSATVTIPIAGPIPAGLILLTANPDSDGSDEVSLLNNAAYAAVAANPDMNCDGVVNTDDIAHFVQALLDPAGYAADHPACNGLLADMNADGQANGGDIQLFINRLYAP
ncbi:MAG: hypothetical protein L6Q92_05825 [Phycisphaerae bacterium]|nr:hypothetical protein [Phycisphaerae bacterium]